MGPGAEGAAGGPAPGSRSRRRESRGRGGTGAGGGCRPPAAARSAPPRVAAAPPPPTAKGSEGASGLRRVRGGEERGPRVPRPAGQARGHLPSRGGRAGRGPGLCAERARLRGAALGAAGAGPRALAAAWRPGPAVGSLRRRKRRGKQA